MKRPIHFDQTRVINRFWNEVTLEKSGIGPDNPKVSIGTIVGFHRSDNFGTQCMIRFDGTQHIAYVPLMYNSLELVGDPRPFTVRPEDNRRLAGVPRKVWHQRYADYVAACEWFDPQDQFGRTQPRPVMDYGTWMTRRRDSTVRWRGLEQAQQRLKRAAHEMRRRRRNTVILMEMLRTPMVFPPGHPGCDEPIYPTANAEGTWLGDRYVCRTHGDVTPAVMAHYYPDPAPKPPGRTRTRRWT